MSWLMYATRSTTRTILPSSVSGSSSPVCVRMPCLTSSVRFSRSAIRSECSLWRNLRPKRCEQRVERVLARVPERRMSGVVAEADRLDEVFVEPQRARDDARDRRGLERVRDARAVVVARRVDEDLRLALEAAERLRVDDPVAVALEGRPDRRFLLRLAAARASRTSGPRAARACAPRPRARALRTSRPRCGRSRSSPSSLNRGAARAGRALVTDAREVIRTAKPIAKEGEMAVVESVQADSLREKVRGEVIAPGDGGVRRGAPRLERDHRPAAGARRPLHRQRRRDRDRRVRARARTARLRARRRAQRRRNRGRRGRAS